ncbi:MAG: tripartite tricarboxylate transporter substrate binding protein [Burkholderiaceae bacterium]
MVLANPSRRRNIGHALRLSAAMAVGLPSAARAQAWPNRPIRIIVGFAPGGTADIYARSIGQHWSSRLGQPVVVENRPGAAALIALEMLAKSAPDGYTFALAPTSSYWQSRVLFKKIPFDPDADLTPMTLLPAGPLILGAAPDLPIRDLAGLVAHARAHKTSIGTFAPGSGAHMVIEAINRAYGLSITAVHYRGEAPMWLDAAANQVQAGLGTYATFAAVQDKGVRPIAVTTSSRSPKLPDVPTLVEQGMTDRFLALESWTSLVAPAGTPPPILARLADLATEFADTPRGLQFRDQFGISAKPLSFAETTSRAREDAPVSIDMTRSLGITLD